MYILGFETTGPICSVALMDLENRENIHMINGNEPMSHLKDLTKNARRLMDENKIKVDEIKAVAASIGPGSFTGIRIGVTTARSVAQTLGITCVAVPTLESFKTKEVNGIVVPIFNARRGQVYGAIFLGEEDVLAPGPYMLTDVLDRLKEYLDSSIINEEEKVNITFFGDGIDAYTKELEAYNDELEGEGPINISFADKEHRYQTADMIVKLAASKYDAGDLLSPEELLPDYMRKAEAEQKLEDGTLEKLRKAKLARLLGEA